MKKALFILLVLFFASLAYAQDFSSYKYVGSFDTGLSQPQFSAPGFNKYYTSEQIKTYWPVYDNKEACEARQDFLVQILPGGCSPAVVRSDLLAEQDVPVFCQLSAIKLNPIIDVKNIDSITFKGKYPKEVLGTSFHPARAAIRTTSKLLGSPVLNNIGYVVILLKRNEIESSIPGFIKGNLTATIRYDLEKAFGVGRAEFVLKQMGDEEWERDYVENSFWKGQGYLRLENLDNEKAEISIYKDKDEKINSVSLEKGKTSKDIYLPGFYCKTALQITLNNIETPRKSAKLLISGKEDEELELYEGNSFLNGKCGLEKIVPREVGGTAAIRCLGKSYELKIGVNNNFNFSIDNTAGSRKLWDKIEGEYIAYYGSVNKNIVEDENNREFIVLIKPTTSLLTEKEKADFEKKIEDKVKEAEKEVLKEKDGAKKQSFEQKLKSKLEVYSSTFKPEVIFVNEEKTIEVEVTAGGGDKKVKFLGAEIKDVSYGKDSEIENYFSKAVENYKDLINLYPFEKVRGKEETYGEKGILSAISFAIKLTKKNTALELIDLAKRTYSGKTAEEAEKIKLGVKYSDENSVMSAYINDELYVIRLESVKKPSLEDASVYIVFREVDDKELAGKTSYENNYAIDDFVYEEKAKSIKDKKEECVEYVKVSDLKDDEVVIDYRAVVYSEDRQKTESCKEEKNVHVKKDELKRLGRFSLQVKEISLKKIAKVSLKPRVLNTYSEVNFSYNIGIEKRAIKLSPGKTEERIKNLNESIKKFEDINKRLGNVVSGLKGACLATSAYVIAKNLVTGFSGESLARQKVMREQGGWVDRCRDLMQENPEKYKGPLASEPSLDRCLGEHADEISSDIEKMNKIIEEQNKDIKSSWKTETTVIDKLTKEEFVNSKETALDYYSKHKNELSSIEGLGNNEIVTEMINNGELGVEDLRDLVTAQQLGNSNSDVLKAMAEKTISQQQERIKIIAKTREAQEEFEKSSGMDNFKGQLNSRNFQILEPLGTNKPFISPIKLNSAQANSLSSDGVNFKAEDKVIFYTIPGSLTESKKTKKVVAKLKQQGSEYVVDEAYEIKDDGKTGADATIDLNTALSKANIASFREFAPETCKNDYIKPEVKYYESGSYKGLPAIVPVDTANGWYAATKQTLGVLGNIKAFEESGRVTSFWLCNVGKNKREEFNSGGRDDICSMINLGIGQPDEIGCLTRAEAKTLVEKAVRNLYSAAEQYGKGNKVTIDGRVYNVGKPAVSIPSTQCQDFMSVNDCNLLFNVCDPVICPSSRCDLGGSYPVEDVIQTGIIGSIFLCLPNFGNPLKGGVAIPVCLSGIHSGLESYVSLLRAHRDCLQENLDTGKMTGFCDEIYSIYMCEFFWRQFSPVMRAIIPKVIALAFGQGTRGGGEYATVTTAWNNAEKSIDYMRDVYMANAYKAFQLRSIEEAGSEVCKAFIGTKYPSQFKAWLEPDSPVQYHAYFSEIPFSEASVPSTSQYKVFYHIFAGKDSGVSYSVYLKSPPETSYYIQNPIVSVRTGYIGKGDYKDETIDFTAPSGYKELCLRINGQDKCGFKQVSSSFAINYAKDMYMEEQAKENIATETDCISGTSSFYSLLQPNVQAGAEEIVNPEIYKRGIIRVCSSLDPGLSVDSSQEISKRRWQDVGYCDKANNIKCWLDTDSVKEVIKDKAILNSTLTDIEKQVKEKYITSGEIFSEVDTVSKSGIIEKKKNALDEAVSKAGNIDVLNKIYKIAGGEEIAGLPKETTEAGTINYAGVLTEINEIIQKGYYNYQRANALLLKAEIYSKLAEKAWEIENPKKEVEKKEEPKIEVTLRDNDCELKQALVFAEGEDSEPRWIDLIETDEVNSFPSVLKLIYSNKCDNPIVEVKLLSDSKLLAFYKGPDKFQFSQDASNKNRWTGEITLSVPTEMSKNYFVFEITCKNCDGKKLQIRDFKIKE